jgi:glycosyltransferase involved in cell wall biosynthesis
MAAGVPVLAAKVGGVPDLIEEGVSGLLFDPNDADAMRAAVLRLLSDSQAAGSMAAAGRKRAREHHHPVEIARQHVKVYREVLETRR